LKSKRRPGIDADSIERGVHLILEGLGVDMTDQNYLETPERVARFYLEMFGKQDTEFATFEEKDTDFVLMRGHRMWTLCPHHLVPVELVVSMAYIPSGHVLGLSKLIRILNETNNGPLLQERFTREALTTLKRILPKVGGSGILVHGQHGCTKVRGVQSNAWFTTYRFEGKMESDPKLQERFFQLVGHQA
jgi:GTP cyclohydrolase I